MKQRTRSLPLLVLVAVVALVLGSVGTASATGLTKHTVKKIAAKVIHKQAGGLSVAHATTADSATTATNATNAGNAATLGGLAANQLARASTASSPFFGAISSSSFVNLTSRSFTAPTAGILVVQGSVAFNQLAGNGNPADIQVRLAVDGAAASIDAPGHDANGSGTHSSLSVSGAVPVTAGAHTVAVQGLSNTTGGSFIGPNSVTAIFVPFGATGGAGVLNAPLGSSPAGANQ